MLTSNHRKEYSEVPTRLPATTGESVDPQNSTPVAHQGLLHSNHAVVSLKTFAWVFGALLLFALGLATYLILRGDTTSGSELNASHPIVTIPQGKLQGYTMLTSESRTVYAFVGVPYAQPPVGDLRFMSPVAPNRWRGILNASHEMPLCPQRDVDGSVIGDEDCLYLHIYTPKLPTKENSTLLPVIFWIVGGGFDREVTTPDRYGPDFLLNEDVLLVIPTSRVGVLGFLTTGDEVAPGNYGTKDYVRALEWTQENIKYFGGDPHQVTLTGASSGGMSVSLLTLTNATEGLFHRFITQSGLALWPKLLESRKLCVDKAFKLGENFGCQTNTSTLLIDCLRAQNASQLVDTESLFYEWKTWPFHNWHPTVEPDIEGALITERVATLVAEGKGRDIPWLNCNVRDESSGFTIIFSLNSTLFEEFLTNIDVALPAVAEYSKAVSNVTAYTEALKSHFFPDLTANRTLLLKNLTQLLNDFTFLYPSYNMLQQRLSVAKNSVYHSSFEYRGIFSYSYKYSGGDTNYTSIWHGDELIYLFRDHNDFYGPSSYEYSKNDMKMVENMVKMWTSFVINGEPTPADENGTILWEPYSSSQNYLQIGNESDTGLFVQRQLNQKDRMEFWDHLITAVPWA